MSNVIRQDHSARWTAYHGDCIEVVQGIPSNSIDYSIFSPPFASLYTYSASERDMGNSRGYSEFAQHFAFLVQELYRIIKPGRLVSIHCMNLPTTIQTHGTIGIQDFRGDLIRMMQSAALSTNAILHSGDTISTPTAVNGFIYHSEVCIWKDPVQAMQRTKALGLLHKQLKKDSSMSRQGIPDYLVTFRKPGVNDERITHTDADMPVSIWQRYASPVWMDINPSDTLQYTSAREHADERHICPLQLEVIRRGIQLWTNPNDVVFTPFGGIGSEAYVAMEQGRRAVLVELKESYYRQAVANLRSIEQVAALPTLFDLMDAA